MEDAWNRITNTPHAVGHNYQVMDLHKGTVVDIEMAPFDRLLILFYLLLNSLVDLLLYLNILISIQICIV